MVLTARARRILGSLPAYYHGNDLVERALQGAANEIDRVEDAAVAIRDGLIPSQATDEFGLLGLWEATLELPVEPAGATLEQRRGNVEARLRTIGDSSARQTMAALRALAGNAIVVYRNTPDFLFDTIEIPYDPGSYSSGQIEELADRLWPAHRVIVMRYSQGFILDVSLLDQDAL